MKLMDAPAPPSHEPERSCAPRVLHVLAPAPYGGLENVVASLAAAQARAGCDVHVAAVLDGDVTDHPLLDAMRAAHVHTYPLRVAPRAYRHERSLVRGVCEAVQPQVVHTHGYRVDVLHTPIVRALHLPTVSTSHGFTGGDWKNRIYERLQRRAYRHCDAVVAVSRPMASALLAAGVPRGRLHVVPNAWTAPFEFLGRAEARRQLGIDESERCIGFVGRLSPEKGPDTFIDAAAQLPDAGTFVVVGDGRLRGALMARARARGLRHVRWTGAREGAGRLMKAFDAFVLSSRTEGTPVVLLEAMAARVPIVAARVGGVPGVLSNREAILVVPDDPTALAAAISDVLAHPEAAGWRSERALERLQSRFSAARWIERYARVYAAVGVPMSAAAS